MSGELGQMITCTKCKTNLFLKYLGKQDMYGGWESYNKFEAVPKDWLYGNEFGYLCPKCSREFKLLVSEFFGNEVAPKWSLNE